MIHYHTKFYLSRRFISLVSFHLPPPLLRNKIKVRLSRNKKTHIFVSFSKNVGNRRPFLVLSNDHFSPSLSLSFLSNGIARVFDKDGNINHFKLCWASVAFAAAAAAVSLLRSLFALDPESRESSLQRQERKNNTKDQGKKIVLVMMKQQARSNIFLCVCVHSCNFFSESLPSLS